MGIKSEVLPRIGGTKSILAVTPSETARLERENRLMSQRLEELKAVMMQQSQSKRATLWGSGAIGSKGLPPKSTASGLTWSRKKRYAGIIKASYQQYDSITFLKADGDVERVGRPSLLTPTKSSTGSTASVRLKPIERNSSLPDGLDREDVVVEDQTSSRTWRVPSALGGGTPDPESQFEEEDDPSSSLARKAKSNVYGYETVSSFTEGSSEDPVSELEKYEQESHQSFLQALNEWRNAGVLNEEQVSSAIVAERPVTATGTSTSMTMADRQPNRPSAAWTLPKSEPPKRHSYISQLLATMYDERDNMQVHPLNASQRMISYEEIDARRERVLALKRQNDLLEEELDEDSNDRMPPLSTECQSVTDISDDEDIEQGPERMEQNTQGPYQSDVFGSRDPLFIVQDVTDREEDAILESLDQGLMIECIDRAEVRIVEPHS